MTHEVWSRLLAAFIPGFGVWVAGFLYIVRTDPSVAFVGNKAFWGSKMLKLRRRYWIKFALISGGALAVSTVTFFVL